MILGPAIVLRLQDAAGAVSQAEECGQAFADQRPNAEVILTFAVDHLIDYFTDSEPMQSSLHRLGVTLPSKAEAIGIGGEQWRRVIQHGLHNEIPRACESKFYTPFFIRSNDAHRDFWLIHLSGHHRARDVMVGLHWKHSTDFAHYGKAGFDMLGYDPSNDSRWTSQRSLPTFQFDEAAKSLSQAELLGQLPKLLSQFNNPISFEQFFACTTNQTPVTSEIMKEVIDRLAKEGEIVVRSIKGKRRRSQKVSEKTDILSINRQMRIHFGNSE